MAPTHSGEYRRMLDRLCEARVASELTQVQVAKQLGKPQSFVSKVELGERRIDPVELQQLAKLYGKAVEWFLT